MKTCTSCGAERPLSDFSTQKTNRSKLYAWCDACRGAQLPFFKKTNEYQILRDKAKQLRRFDDAAAAVLRERKANGAKPKDLALEFNCSISTINKTLNRR